MTAASSYPAAASEARRASASGVAVRQRPDPSPCRPILPEGGTKVHIVVCVKQVPDWDIPPSSFKVDEAREEGRAAAGRRARASQFDAIAVEAAMRIKDAGADAKVTIMSMGAATARDVIKHGLAMGADEGVLLTDDAFNDLDSNGVATVLSAAIKKLGDVDLVLTGRQAVDWDIGVTGTLIAGDARRARRHVRQERDRRRRQGDRRARAAGRLRDGRGAAAGGRHRQQRAGRAALPEAPADHGGGEEAGDDLGRRRRRRRCRRRSRRS